MRPIHAFLSLIFTFSFAFAISGNSKAVEPIMLLGTLQKWQYPDSVIGPSRMSSGDTISADGNLTVYSIFMKSTMVTTDSVDEVLAFYRDLLKRSSKANEKIGIGPSVGQSVIFSDDSEGRPFEFHTILINSKNSSTTLIITRGKGEEQTRITWKQYLAPDIER